jgi:hypothetical protein
MTPKSYGPVVPLSKFIQAWLLCDLTSTSYVKHLVTLQNGSRWDPLVLLVELELLHVRAELGLVPQQPRIGSQDQARVARDLIWTAGE